MLPDSELMRIVNQAHFEERSRKRDAVALLRAMVIAAATGYGGRQRDVARLYFESGAPEVGRGGFNAWFDPELEAAMEQVAKRAQAYANKLPLDLPPLLSKYARDFHIVDSRTVKLQQELFAEYPGTGRYAALKVHKRLSVGLGRVVDYHVSCARDPDAPHLVLDRTSRQKGNDSKNKKKPKMIPPAASGGMTGDATRTHSRNRNFFWPGATQAAVCSSVRIYNGGRLRARNDNRRTVHGCAASGRR